ncbi:hypothetical protein [Pseudonocardia endophytica]|uniref:TfoX-like protein n=1 Tax=Pseudonocardia endophytica TaxID=401976 RepID=A0A4R1HPG0_PSEEN|nr:hypothetical protein [Pseudonocardia endophytica]TCK21629.1 hypothetical protein EV378_5618 [Pseudonocardia endophytica]
MTGDPDARFHDLCLTFADQPDVEQPGGDRAFGSAALTTGRKIFAMLVGGRLVVKLPAARVAESIADGTGERFEGSRGRPMKEWLTVADTADWSAIAREAHAFVARR